MGFLNLLSSKKVPIMKEAPITERMEVTFSTISKVWACDGVIDMATVGCAVPPYVHTEVQVTCDEIKRVIQRCCGGGSCLLCSESPRGSNTRRVGAVANSRKDSLAAWRPTLGVAVESKTGVSAVDATARKSLVQPQCPPTWLFFRKQQDSRNQRAAHERKVASDRRNLGQNLQNGGGDLPRLE